MSIPVTPILKVWLTGQQIHIDLKEKLDQYDQHLVLEDNSNVEELFIILLQHCYKEKLNDKDLSPLRDLNRVLEKLLS